MERALDVGRLGRIVLVGDRFHAAGRECAALGQLEQPEPGAALDEDVQAPVLELLHDLSDGGQRPDLTEAVVVGVDDAERAPVHEALPDQLAVARLEDVQRHLLGGQQHEPEGKEADLRHHLKPTPPCLRLTRARCAAGQEGAQWSKTITPRATSPRLISSKASLICSSRSRREIMSSNLSLLSR